VAAEAAEIARARSVNDRRLFRALVLAVAAGVLVDAVVLVIAGVAGGDGALPSAALGSGLALVVTLPTLITARAGRNLEIMGEAALLAGSWLVKMFVLVIIILLVSDATWLERPWLGAALLLGAIASAVTEAAILVRNRARLEVARPSVTDEDE
jgi:hypothetical protein